MAEDTVTGTIDVSIQVKDGAMSREVDEGGEDFAANTVAAFLVSFPTVARNFSREFLRRVPDPSS
jgi:hypothetical protein